MEKTNWSYIISKETPEIMGSGSTFSNIVRTRDEKKAFELLSDGRNRLERIGKVNGEMIVQYYDDGKWIS